MGESTKNVLVGMCRIESKVAKEKLLEIIPVIGDIQCLVGLNHFLHRTEEIEVGVHRVLGHPHHIHSPFNWYQRVIAGYWSSVGGLYDGVGASSGGEEEPLGCEDGGKVRWSWVRGVGEEGAVVVVVGKGGVEMERGRWWWWMVWVRLG